MGYNFFVLFLKVCLQVSLLWLVFVYLYLIGQAITSSLHCLGSGRSICGFVCDL